jgi:hypothetical protein
VFLIITECQFWYSVLGLIVGVLYMLCGVKLFLNGVTGSATWTIQIFGIESHISGALPGVVFGILGFLIIYVTRYYK